MLLETFDTELPIQLLLGLGLGLIFGVAAQITRFCLRRAVAGEDGPDRSALAVWLLALAVAVGAVQGAGFFGLVDLDGHRLLGTQLPLGAIVLGGVMFGIGMVLTRGCASRLTVLSATGNLRALTVLVVFAITAHATMKGVLAPLRTELSAATLPLPFGSLGDVVPFAGVALALALLAAALWLARSAGARVVHMALGAVIGLTAAVGWAATSVLFFDDFDPAPVQSLAFTLPWSDTLFWTVAGTAIPAGFGVGLIGGVFAGAFMSAAARGELALVSFTSGPQTLRYGAGGLLMGVGGVLAGGCTVGAGLSGVAALSFAAILALAAIILGALATQRVLGTQAAQGAVA